MKPYRKIERLMESEVDDQFIFVRRGRAKKAFVKLQKSHAKRMLILEKLKNIFQELDQSIDQIYDDGMRDINEYLRSIESKYGYQHSDTLYYELVSNHIYKFYRDFPNIRPLDSVKKQLGISNAK